jgi:hypothetical protein
MRQCGAHRLRGRLSLPWPRLLIAALACTGAPLAASAGPDLLVYEGFDYDPGSTLEFLDGGTGWGGSWVWRLNFGAGGTVTMNSAIIQHGSLAYAGLATTGNSVLLTGEISTLELGRAFASPVGGGAGTRTYLSYIGQRIGPKLDPSVPDYPWGGNPYPRAASMRFFRGVGERLSVGTFSNRPVDEWMLTGQGLDHWSGVSFSEAPALVVVRIDHHGEAPDDIHMWVNPDLSQPEDLASARISLTGWYDGDGVDEDGQPLGNPLDLSGLEWISPFAGNAGSGRPHAEFLVDEIRIGRTWASVTPRVAPNWGGFPLREDQPGIVETGYFLHRLHVGMAPWVWPEELGAWVYLEQQAVGPSGAWAAFYDFNETLPQAGGETWAGYPVEHGGTVRTGAFMGSLNVSAAPWVWSHDLETWLHASGAAPGPPAWIWAFVVDSNYTEVNLPLAPVAPSPADGDEHVDGDDGTVVLGWNRGQRSTSHDLYFGVDAGAVANADRGSPEFVGNLAGGSATLSREFHGLDHYYWRVDAVNPAGVAKGEVWTFRTRQLAFPGAEGHGRFARGGREGRVIAVTNLNDGGPGSFREAIESEGPRVIVFHVSGLITLESHLTLRDSHVTVAGQTAPGKGVAIRKHKFGLSGGDDCIVRFLRMRPGSIAEVTMDGTGLAGSNHTIMDHCSVSWSHDEGFSSRNARNITLQRSMIAETLNVSGHKNYPDGAAHGYAATIGGSVGSFHNNLLAHNSGRNWSLGGGLDASGRHAGLLDIRNNVVYNWRTRTTDGGAREVNFVNNYYKAGPASTYRYFINPQLEFVDAFGPQIYHVAGNVLDGALLSPPKQVGPGNQEEGHTHPASSYQLFHDQPFFDAHVETFSAVEAYKRVLSDVGCNLPLIDDLDYRVIGEVLDGSFTFRGSATNFPGLIDNQEDSGGWEDYPEIHRPANWDTDGDGLPDWWEVLHGLNPESEPGDYAESRADPDGDGFTRLDAYLHWKATPHLTCDPGGFVDVDLAQLARGFTEEPAFEIDWVAGGSVVLLADGRTARFTAPQGVEALGRLAFTVTDTAGHGMTREVGVRIIDMTQWQP